MSRKLGSMAAGAIANGSQFVINVSKRDMTVGKKPYLWVLGLVSAEVVLLWQYVNSTWQIYEVAGTQVQLSATVLRLELPSHGKWGITKGVTAALTAHLTGV